jgi:hypothetical protein
MAGRKENGIYVVRDEIAVNRYDFDGTAETLKSNIDAIVEKARAKGMVGEGYFDFSVAGDYYDSYLLEVTYSFNRAETDAERINRETAEAVAKAAAAEKRKKAAEARKLKKDTEYAEFLRLKEKFEGK